MRREHEQQYVEYVTLAMPALRRLARLLCGDWHRADDIDRYVRKMLVNTFLADRRRAWSSRVKLTAEPPDRTVGADYRFDDQELLAQVLPQVAPRQRAAVVLRFVYDLPVVEVAELLGCSPGTVKSQTAYGLASLRRLLTAPERAGRDEGVTMPHHGSPHRTDADIASLLGRTDPEPPSTADISRVVHDGRRRVRRRRLLALAGTAAVTAVVVAAVPTVFHSTGDGSDHVTTVPTKPSTIGPSPAPTESRKLLTGGCQVTQLPGPAGTTTALPTVADPTGRYFAAEAKRRSGRHAAVLWVDGKPRILPAAGEWDTSIVGVNAAGVVAVNSGDATNGPQAWVYRGGTMTRLAGTGETVATGINGRGNVVGATALTQSPQTRHGGETPVVWYAGATSPTPLPLPAGAISGNAQDIDDDGTVVGTVLTSTGAQAYVWRPDGRAQRLEAPGRKQTMAANVRNGWVAGAAVAGPGGEIPLLWNLRTGQVREFPGMRFPVDVNADGWLVSQNRQDLTAVLVTPNGEYRLPGLSSHKGRYGDTAYAITDTGLVVGAAATSSGRSQAVAWRCR